MVCCGFPILFPHALSRHESYTNTPTVVAFREPIDEHFGRISNQVYNFFSIFILWGYITRIIHFRVGVMLHFIVHVPVKI